jgi:sortase (surface protein transpeptidase)
MASVKNDQKSRRRPVPQRPPSARLSDNSARRVKKIFVPLFSHRIEVSLRKFRTNKARRSKRYRQLVVPAGLFKIREIAIVIKKKPGRGRTAAAPASLKPLPLRPRMAAAAVLIAAGIGSGGYFAAHLQKTVSFDITPSQSVKALSQPAAALTKVMPRSIPVRLEIPSIGVDTALSQVGLQADGAMQMPWDIETASWYEYSPTPGELGPAVIVGHLDGANYADMTGVFWRLHELNPGDEIKVDRADGSVAVFKVIGLKQVPQSDFPAQEVYGNIKYAGIRLITCGGTFDASTDHYTDNTVVYGALE